MSGGAEWTRVLDTLCPMHVVLDAQGVIRNAGPTLAKLRLARPLEGCRFLDRFDLLRPRAVPGFAAFRDFAGRKLHLRFSDAPPTALKGLMAPLPGDGGAVVNLSFGISILDAVSDYVLTDADFAATDLTMEMLYLVEAKSAAMEASHHLNLRLQGAKIAAEEQAYTDTLTGLKNRRALDLVLSRMMAAQAHFAMMHVDLDYFKAVNDTLGHAAGDHVLQHVARIMVAETRRADTVARVGGDEFVLIFDGLTDRAQIDAIARRLIARLEQPTAFGGEQCRVSCSIGTVLSTDYATPDIARMLEDADQALYASKNAGRARHTFYSADTSAPERRRI
jgi:diguanylate cyclase (GGDEF)-like protein